MMDKFSNPFNITKATDFTDEQIINYWVDFPGNSFVDVIKPKSPMPMFILGGKGSGKTHIMKYFSYELQKLRSTTGIISEVKQCGYIGIYMRCGGMNSNRFQGKNQESDKWISIFQYYLELWYAQLLLKILIDIHKQENLDIENEDHLTNSILSLFDQLPNGSKPTTILEVIELLSTLQKQTDIIVNNAGITKNISSLFIHITAGKLLFGIPKILESSISFFNNIRFLYLIDEFENLPVDHQMHVNTLMREREDPTTFKIGSRLYGVKTHTTLSANEENKEGSEFETFIIDQYFREKKEYNEFVTELCFKRLVENHYPVNNKSKKYAPKDFEQYFEQFDANESIKKITNLSGQKVYFEHLLKKINSLSQEAQKTIVANLQFSDDALIEKTNIFLFYRGWKSLKNTTENWLVKVSEEVKIECQKYNSEEIENSSQYKVLDKFKTDLQAQLFLEFQQEVPYYGFQTFIDMSDGLPRNLLGILKYIFKKSYFGGEKPFNGGLISLNSQIKGVKEASEWFMEDARMPGLSGREARKSIVKLATFFRELRFSDIPPECSLCTFSVTQLAIPEKVNEEIKNCYFNSYLIKVEGTRKERNSERLDQLYQLNGMISPQWALPIYRRGEIKLQNEDAMAIFTSIPEEAFTLFIKNRIKNYNAPFKNKEITNQISF